MKTWFITGISRGFGLELARQLIARGDTVIGTVRQGMPDIAAGPGALHVLTLDVTDRAVVTAAVDQAFTLGPIDVIVNNSGYGLLGALEAASDAEIDRLFATNVFGPIAVIRAALPHLRAQGSGHIVNISSIAGRAPGPGTSLYAATKFAIEGLSGSLAQELAPFGIKVTVVAPGAFRTDFLSDHSIRKSGAPGGGHGASVDQALGALDAMAGRQIGDPARGAAAMIAAVDAAEPPLHLLLGSDALRRARAKLDAVIAEMDRWESVTLGTDFPAGE
jgi:NAD(P)-dependent dehydrogenase (short-subunit alcohol dehydrogenase family)